MIEAKVRFNSKTGELSSKVGEVSTLVRYLKNTIGIYKNQNVDPSELEQINYRVELHNPEPNKEGALQFGTSYLYPGTVNGECFMTKGHFHETENRAEYYFCISGEGLLLYMDKDKKIKIEKVREGSLHYIPGYVAHRLVNVGDEVLVVGACWNSDAGHNYGDIELSGFPVKVMKENGEVKVVEVVK